MRTIIRLQRKGPKNDYVMRMVVQGSYKKLKGMYVENLGFWVPKKMDEHKKSIILNKNRTRYWLAMGAVLGNKVQKFLSAFNMAPAPYIKFGKATAVTPLFDQEKAYRQGLNAYIRTKSQMVPFASDILGKEKAISAQNVYFRRIKFQQQIQNYLDVENVNGFIEEIIAQTPKETSDDSLFDRSQKFFELKRFYDEMERNPSVLAPYKKELIYSRMNEIAELGIMSQPEVLSEQIRIRDSSKLDLIEEAMLKKWEQRKLATRTKLELMESMLNPIDRTEFISLCRQRTLLSEEAFDDNMDEYLRTMSENQSPFTHLDVEFFNRFFLVGMDGVMEEESKEKSQDDEDQVHIPPMFPITPEPDLKFYDPNDWFDLREETTSKVRAYTDIQDRWYDLPLTEARKEQTFNKDFEFINSNFKDDAEEDDFDPDVTRWKEDKYTERKERNKRSKERKVLAREEKLKPVETKSRGH